MDYPTPPGAWRVVVDDFTRDGILDVATANRSPIYRDDCGYPLKTWDSLSILPGSANGTFAAASNFSIGNQRNVNDPFTDRNQVVSLVAPDLNGDHAPDLLVSNGTVFTNKAADPNWAPTVSLGPDATLDSSEDEFVLRAVADDVDQDMLTYSWTASDGIGIAPVPNPCIGIFGNGPHTYTVTVDDGHGHQTSDSVTYTVSGPKPPTISVTAPAAGEVVPAGHPYIIHWTATAGAAPIQRIDLSFSSDGFTRSAITECANLPASATSCQWNNPTVTEQGRIDVTAQDVNGGATAESGQFAVRTTTTTTGLPYGWSHADVGHVAAAGSATHDGFVYNGQGLTVTGSGSDIWGTADEFHFVWQHMTGDFSIDTRVDSLQNVNAWTKGGLMIRGSATDASSPHASIFVSPSKGLAFQARQTEGGSSVSSPPGPVLTAPVWLRLTRQGGLISALYRHNATDPWTTLGSNRIATLAGGVDVGLAVSSHDDGKLATGKFVGIYLAAAPALQMQSFNGSSGIFTTDGTNYTVRGSGTDIWGTNDSFSYANIPIGDATSITLRVRSIGNTDPWAKAGVMIRETLDPWSKQADAIVSPGKGIAMQYRSTTSGASASAAQINGSAPVWLRIIRFESSTPGGDTSFQTEYSTDYTSWRLLSNSIHFPMSHDAFIGIAVTSHHAGTQTVAVIDDLRIER